MSTFDNLRAVWPADPDVVSLTESMFRAYCVLPDAAYLPLSLWIIGTYLTHIFDCYPYFVLTSPLKRCGKTRVEETAELVCSNPLRVASTSAAALFRIMSSQPTVFIDEAEIFKTTKNLSENAQAVLQILNAGHRAGAYVLRCVGKDHHPEKFRTYGPKMLAAIGKFPDTLADRSIIVAMRRKGRDQKVQRFLFRQATEAYEPLKAQIVEWAKANSSDIYDYYVKPSTPKQLEALSDRDADMWIPLLAICAVGSPDRVDEFRKSARVLCSGKEDEDQNETPMRLLTDIRTVFADVTTPNIFTETLIGHLKELSESPWAEWELTPRTLAKYLRPFGITSGSVRVREQTGKGYSREKFDDPFSRYLPISPSEKVTSVTTRANTGENDDFSSVTNGKCDG